MADLLDQSWDQSTISRSTNRNLNGDRSWRRRSVSRGRRFGLAVDELLQLLARLEVRDFLRRYIDFVPRLRVPSLSRLALAKPEASEASQLDLLATVQRVDDALEHRIDDDFGVLLRQIGDSRDL